MTTTSSSPINLIKRSAIAIATATACMGASAALLPPFTFNPAAASLMGTSFSADNILISDYSTVNFDGVGGFTDTGFLSVTAFQNTGTTLLPTGLNSTYGMYFAFTGNGTTTVGNPSTVQTSGAFTTLNYTLYGYNGGPATFGFDASNNPTENASGEVVLGTGSLLNGTVSTTPTSDGSMQFTPSASAKLSFAVATGMEGFFASPNPFYDISFAAFTNTTSQVTAFQGGFRIEQGGGAVNFAMTPAVPEPETYALMLAGLAAVGFIARRRRS
ncbi:MAG: flocculation-associated PEP-CTERM protein PepA [Burkholderiaceae bacterium]